MRLVAVFVPKCCGLFKLIICFCIVGTIVAFRSQVFSEVFHPNRRHRRITLGQACLRRISIVQYTHVVPPVTGLYPARDDGIPARSADPCSSKNIGIPCSLFCQPIKVGRRHGHVSISANPWAHVFRTQPNDVGSFDGSHRLLLGHLGFHQIRFHHFFPDDIALRIHVESIAHKQFFHETPIGVQHGAEHINEFRFG